MSSVITTTGRSISTVTAEIVAISNQAAQIAYMSMVEIGRRLVEVKELVPHGEWGDYLKTEVKFSHRTANNFMQIYERSLTGNNSQTFANLGYSHILKLLSLPDEELEEFAENNDVQNMSVRQLDQAIRERDAAQKAQATEKAEKEAAQAAARDAEQQVLSLQQQVAAAKSSEGAWQEEIDKLTSALNKATATADKAKRQLKELRDNPKISDDQKAELLAEAKAQAAEEIRSEIQAQLEAVSVEKAAAESRAQEAEAQLEAMRKSAKVSNPDVAAFRFLGKQIAEDCNRMAGYRMKAAANDPDLDAKMKEYMLKLSELFRARAEGTSMTQGG